MDLVSGSPLWLCGHAPESSPATPALERDLECDIVIIGAGITGALLADRLASSGRRVVVVDRRWRALGSTSACTALVLFEIDTPLAPLIELIGERDAMRAYRSSHRAVRSFIEIVESLAVPVGFERRPTLYLASNTKDAETLPEEAALRRIAGVEAELLDGDRLRAEYGIERPAAIRSESSAVVDPVALTRALLARAEAAGVAVYEGVAVDGVETAADGVVVGTAGGPVIRAGHVIFASGYESDAYLREKVAVLKSTYAFATRPVPRDRLWTDEALLWETARPYIYVRTTPDGRIIVGGADDDFRDPARRAAYLTRRVEQVRGDFMKLLPGITFEIETSWAGTFSETKDGLPYIGQSPERAGASFALGYGGNGVTFSVLAAEILGAQLAGEQHPEEDLYRFGRPGVMRR